MFKPDRLIALDIGASKLVVAEFGISKANGPELLNYGIGNLDVGATGEADTSAYVVSTIRQIMKERAIRPAPLYMTISGQTVFPRFVKLPPVARDKIHQIIRYEAEQNVPFPIEEVVWDYQILGGEQEHEAELNAMLVAVKTENVSRLTDCVVAAGLEPEVVDVAPLALYNAVRYNYPDLQGCTMLLDMGARSSSLVFIEEERIFNRSIPVAGNTVTQELMKEFGVSFAEAEALKRQHAFVAFGGVYAGPDNEVAERVSKVVRNVVTRLHAEVNRSINFYRGQQGGSPPSLVLLSGGSARVPHMDTFFREKLKVDVEYLNPFARIPVSEAIPGDQIERDLHLLGEVSGLAIRRSLSCPVEISLMPPELVARKRFRRRQPYFAIAALGLVFIMLCWWVYFRRMRSVWEGRVHKLERQLAIRSEDDKALSSAIALQRAAGARHAEIAGLVDARMSWIEWIEAIHASMLEGMWIRSLTPIKKEDGLYIEVVGRGFDDLLKKAEAPPQAPAVEQFRDRLRAQPCFTEATAITALPAPMPGAYARDFTLLIGVKDRSKTVAPPDDSQGDGTTPGKKPAKPRKAH